MRPFPRPNVQLLVGVIVGALGAVAFVIPGFAQTVVSRPKLSTTAIKTAPQMDLAKMGRRREFYNQIRMPIESLDFSPSDNKIEQKLAAQKLHGACSAFLVMSPEGIPEFEPILAEFEFRLYDSLRGKNYTLIDSNPGSTQGTKRPYDPAGRECFWFESEDKGNRVMLALDRKSRTIKASFTRVQRDPKNGGPLVTVGEISGVFALRVEVSYNATKVTHVGDTVFRLYDFGEAVKESEPLEYQTRHLYFRSVY